MGGCVREWRQARGTFDSQCSGRRGRSAAAHARDHSGGTHLGGRQSGGQRQRLPLRERAMSGTKQRGDPHYRDVRQREEFEAEHDRHEILR